MIFSFHNFFRGKKNIITDGALILLKYLISLVIFTNSFADYKYYKYFIFLYLESALVRTIEFGVGNKYILFCLWKYDVDKRRIFYFYYTLLLATALLSAFINKSFWGLAVGVAYLLCCRVICALAMKSRKVGNDRYHNSK